MGVFFSPARAKKKDKKLANLKAIFSITIKKNMFY